MTPRSSISITVADSETRLGAAVPRAYKILVDSQSALLMERGYDPKTLLILNLELRELLGHEHTNGRFFVLKRSVSFVRRNACR